MQIEPYGTMRKSRAKSLEYEENGAMLFKVVQEYGDFINTGERRGLKIFEKYGEMDFKLYV